MGLDGVELVMATEETFDIAIDNSDAAEIVTVADLESLVIRLLGDRIGAARDRNACCSTQHTFYRLRRALRKHPRFTHKQVRPGDRWDALIPLADLRQIWRYLAETLSTRRLPALKRNRGLKNLIACIVPLGGLTALLGHALADWPGRQCALAVLGAIIAAWALWRLTAPWARHFNNQYPTVGALVGHLADMRPAALRTGNQKITEREVKDLLRIIIAEQLDVAPSLVTPEAEFVKDLGLQ